MQIEFIQNNLYIRKCHNIVFCSTALLQCFNTYIYNCLNAQYTNPFFSTTRSYCTWNVTDKDNQLTADCWAVVSKTLCKLMHMQQLPAAWNSCTNKLTNSTIYNSESIEQKSRQGFSNEQPCLCLRFFYLRLS